MILGFDFGTKKIGIASGQTITQTATPLQIIKATDGEPDWALLQSIIEQWQPIALVVGLPLNEDMSESKTSIKAKDFGDKLNEKFNLDVHYVSEYLTSSEARRLSKESQRHSRELVDAIAAALILESWLKGEGHVG